MNSAPGDYFWNDFAANFLKSASDLGFAQRLVGSNESSFNARKCSVIAFSVTSEESVELVEELFRQRASNRDAIVVLFGGANLEEEIVLEKYRMFVRENVLPNSVLIGIESKMFHHDLFFDETDQSMEDELITKLNHLKQVWGWPLRMENPLKSVYIRRAWTIQKGAHNALFKELAASTNATLEWISPDKPDPQYSWFITNQIDVVVSTPYIPVVELDFIEEHQLQGLCLLIPEQISAGYDHHLLKPFKTTLWILIAIIIGIAVVLNAKFDSLFKASIILQILFGSPTGFHQCQWIERASVLIMSWLMFVLCEIYTNKLIPFMLNTKYEPHIRSFAELNSTNFNIVIKDAPFLRKINIPKFDRDRIEYRHNVSNLSPNEIYLTQCYWANLIVRSSLNLDPTTKQPKFYVMPEVTASVLFSNAFLPKSVFANKFKTIYDVLFDAGIWDHWTEWENKEFKRQDELEHRVLTFKDLIANWKIIGYGCVINWMVLLLEVAVFHRMMIQLQVTRVKDCIIKCLVESFQRILQVKRWKRNKL